MWRIITGIIFAIITVLLGVYVTFTSRQKGPIFSNSYIWLSEKERQNVDRKDEYQLVTIVFGLLGLMSLCETLHIFTQLTVFMILGVCVIVADIVYAIVNALKCSKKI